MFHAPYWCECSVVVNFCNSGFDVKASVFPTSYFALISFGGDERTGKPQERATAAPNAYAYSQPILFAAKPHPLSRAVTPVNAMSAP